MSSLVNIALVLCAIPVWVAYQTGMLTGLQLGFAAAMIGGILVGAPGWLLAAGAAGCVVARQTGHLDSYGVEPATITAENTAVLIAALGLLVWVLLRAPHYAPWLAGAAAIGLAYFSVNPDADIWQTIGSAPVAVSV